MFTLIVIVLSVLFVLWFVIGFSAFILFTLHDYRNWTWYAILGLGWPFWIWGCLR
jgi:hypothetical protein